MNEQNESRFGKLALMLSLGGLVLAVVIGLLARYFNHNADTTAYLVFLSFQVAAIVLGVVARRDPMGKTAAITASILAVGSLPLVG